MNRKCDMIRECKAGKKWVEMGCWTKEDQMSQRVSLMPVERKEEFTKTLPFFLTTVVH